MKNLSVGLIILLFAASGFVFSCSDNNAAKTEKGAIEKMNDETAKKISDKMLEPVEHAKEVTQAEKNRLQDLQDKVQQEAAGQ